MMGFEMKATGTDLAGQQVAGKSYMKDSQMREGAAIVDDTLAMAKFEKAWKNLAGANTIHLTLTHDGNKNEQFESKTFDIKDEASMKEFVQYMMKNGLSGENVLDSIATALDHIATAGISSGFGNTANMEMKIDT